MGWTQEETTAGPRLGASVAELRDRCVAGDTPTDRLRNRFATVSGSLATIEQLVVRTRRIGLIRLRLTDANDMR